MKKRRIKRWVKVTFIFLLAFILMTIYEIRKIKNAKEILYTNSYVLYAIKPPMITIPKPKPKKVVQKTQPIKNTSSSYKTRMTSYYTGDGYGNNTITGTGLKPSDFGVNSKGWYMYKGKLVIATATPYLLKYGYSLGNGVHTYKYYEELVLNIDGVDYNAIVLDSCGNCMKTDRIDLFVSNRNSVKDAIITVKK